MPFTMTPETTNSWIFLAVAMASSESPTTLGGIIGIADGINHAVPTHKELQNAFGWLSKQGLISKQGKKYQLTDKGLALYKEASAKSNLIFGMWDFLKERFSNLNSETEIDSLTAEEVDVAHKKYNKEFWKEFRK
jgi:DNA-binding PadR family transcriptional regulator